MKAYSIYSICFILFIAAPVLAIPPNYQNVNSYGVVGNGRDVSAALQRAVNSGKSLYFPPGKYYITKPVFAKGKVTWLGSGIQSVILSDQTVLQVTGGSNSTIDNLCFKNVTTPWVIIRNPQNLSSAPIIEKNNTKGYQPTVNDTDVWGKLTTLQQQQDIGPRISFAGRAENITVSRIYGNFVSLLISDAQNSVVKNCNFKAGKNVFGGIVFANIKDQPGTNNKALYNKIIYASFNGIVFLANKYGHAEHNINNYCGESGIKLYQGSLSGVDARCYNMYILNNSSSYNFYDGFDLTSNNPRTGNVRTSHQVKYNYSAYNGGAGFYAEGIDNVLFSNQALFNMGSGIDAILNSSSLSNNTFKNNNRRNAQTGVHEISLAGSGNTISNNVITHLSTSGGYAIYATEANKISGNKADGGAFFFGVPGAIKARLSNNTTNHQ